MQIRNEFQVHCTLYGLDYKDYHSCESWDNSTLFCPAGMQRYKPHFGSDIAGVTLTTTQKCLRLNDIDLLGDGTHLALFDMLGLFSFRHWSVEQAIQFWMHFLRNIDCLPDYVTIHPERLEDWNLLYSAYGVEIRTDEACRWSDGEIGGYCTEFYKNDVEIGNIVNPLGNCIDCGFGLQRIELVLGAKPKTEVELYYELCHTLIHEENLKPSATGKGYVLRKALHYFIKNGLTFSHSFFESELKRYEANQEKYSKLKNKYPDKDPAWWWETHGINI